MQKIANEILVLINEFGSKLLKLNDREWHLQSAPDKWTKKEILGHLVDSAANNHQRFVRLQFEDNPTITYDQNSWVKYQNYNKRDSVSLIELWIQYNKHLVHIIENVNESDFPQNCNIKSENPVTLEWLITDYFRHLKHHLNQIV